MSTDYEYWLEIVDYDLETAEAMYSTGRWLYVGFMCHQVVEKVLKAYWCVTCDDEARYPRYKDELFRQLTPANCRNIIDKTKEMQQWIKDKLSNRMKQSK